MDIGENIKVIRELKGFSQEVMSTELNLSQKTYSNIEKSGNNISFERIIKIAEILEVSVQNILNFRFELILNSKDQIAHDDSLKGEELTKYTSEKQSYLYKQIIEEKDKLLAEKDKVIELLSKVS